MEDGISRGLQHRHEMYCEKDGHCGRWACMVQRWFHHGDIISGQMDLYMTNMANYIYLQKLGQLRKIVYSMSTIHYCMVLSFSNSIVLWCIMYSKFDLCLLQAEIALIFLTNILTTSIGMKILDWFAKLCFVPCFKLLVSY